MNLPSILKTQAIGWGFFIIGTILKNHELHYAAIFFFLAALFVFIKSIKDLF